MRVVSVSVTEAGRALAERLPFERTHGQAAETVRELWGEVDGFVLMLATGAATRIIAPLLGDKAQDPAVVCVDETARWAVALCGGHQGGANALARDVAAGLGAEAVVTTATDASGLAALDMFSGFRPSGDVARVSAAILAGRSPIVSSTISGWPTPLALRSGEGPERVVVTDTRLAPQKGLALLHPPSLVAGAGCSTDAPADEIARLLESTLEDAGLARASVSTLATIDRRVDHPSVRALGLPVRSFCARELASVPVPNPSSAVNSAVGTPSVAEAAAILAAGSEAELVVAKRVSLSATIAVARRKTPRGQLSVVGLGPGAPAHRTAAAAVAVRAAEVVIGYRPYLEQAEDLLCPSQTAICSAIGDEVERARRALTEASAGRRVAVVCSGDPGVFAMASIVIELAVEEAPEIDIEVVPGVTAANSVASLLGAPLGHDHVVVSLSDLLTPWETIAERLGAAAGADLVVALYNPRSAARAWQLEAALDILREHRSAQTPVGVVTDAYRCGQRVTYTTLAEIDASTVGMRSCVVVGSSTTKIGGGRMFTPRGYRP
jgi:cobalt-precorrin 5A hydrolase / precorrin-3B C17-methyltransferase